MFPCWTLLLDAHMWCLHAASMDHLQYWRREGQSFFQRLFHWVDILDPSSLLASDGEIKNSRSLLESKEQANKDELKVKEAWKLSLSSVHPDTGSVLPLVFRPPAFLPVAAPLVIATLLPHKGVKPALFWQFLFQSYSAGFNYVNRNATSCKDERIPLKQVLLFVSSVSYATCAGVLPQLAMNRYGLNSPAMQSLFRRIVPVPLFASLSALSVLVVRGEEFENGIEVVDSTGNVVGVSQTAGMKAVKETAISRAALIGTTAAVPNVIVSFLQRTSFIKRSPLVLAPFRHITTALVLGLMIPISFSLFPQAGKVTKEDLDAHIQAATTEPELYYHRGL
ncbi:sideroflexin-4 [Acipenser oxyrinchus oxyrinchus]|uniref:Sideroflexin-4 n=1 Tax=Acipenser oxyrinchus oxyrinchus TaxID=40147 RepID=A0AAD8G738_ACIOX|nr:sideroflexin-4 [Acipenser oxyrinchus oxyrinchus]